MPGTQEKSRHLPDQVKRWIDLGADAAENNLRGSRKRRVELEGRARGPEEDREHGQRYNVLLEHVDDSWHIVADTFTSLEAKTLHRNRKGVSVHVSPLLVPDM